MPVKSTRFKTQTIFDGEITGLNEREKNVLKKAGIGGASENVLVAPTGLTKTELVGVGTNGQENIEIGDNLTLANGKLNASVGDSESAFDIITLKSGGKYNGQLTGEKPVIAHSGHQIIDDLISISYVPSGSDTFATFINVNLIQLDDDNSDRNELTFGIFRAGMGTISRDYVKVQSKTYYHFIALTNSTATFYFAYQNIVEDELNTLDSLKKELNGKSLLCNGHSDDSVAEYISGEDGNINVGIVNMSTHTSSKITIDSAYTITDKVSPIE